LSGGAGELADLPPADLRLKKGERLVYDIRVNGIPAGNSVLEVTGVEGEEKGPEKWVIELFTRSSRAVSWLFYDVDDHAFSRIDTKKGFSRAYWMKRNEGEVKSREEIGFTYDIGNMEAEYRRPRPNGQLRISKIPLAGKVLDPLAAVYYLRALKLRELQPGAVVYLPICADARVWNTGLKVERFETCDAGQLRGRQCVVIEPQADFRGLFERKGRMLVWVDVETGIPLRLTAEIPIGPAEAMLSKAEGSPLPEKR
jgi:hypothetical protein